MVLCIRGWWLQPLRVSNQSESAKSAMSTQVSIAIGAKPARVVQRKSSRRIGVSRNRFSSMSNMDDKNRQKSEVANLDGDHGADKDFVVGIPEEIAKAEESNSPGEIASNFPECAAPAASHQPAIGVPKRRCSLESIIGRRQRTDLSHQTIFDTNKPRPELRHEFLEYLGAEKKQNGSADFELTDEERFKKINSMAENSEALVNKFSHLKHLLLWHLQDDLMKAEEKITFESGKDVDISQTGFQLAVYCTSSPREGPHAWLTFG